MSGECRQQLASEFVLENASFSTCHVQQVSARLRVTAFDRDQHLDATAAAFSGADTRDRESIVECGRHLPADRRHSVEAYRHGFMVSDGLAENKI
jgi:hypothetical protein